MSRSPRASDVAARAGVSRSAVSRAFTEGASVAPDTRTRIMAAAEELGYRVNYLARSLKEAAPSKLVALVVSDMDHSLRARLVDLLARRLVARGFRPVLLPWSQGDDPHRVIDMMLNYNVSGAIVTSDTPPGEISQQCARFGVPLVLVNKAPVDARAARVVQDTASAGRMAAELLHEAGCRRVLYAGQTRASFTIDDRRRVFCAALDDLGMTLAGEVTGPSQNHAGGMVAAGRYLAAKDRVDGVHCANDFLALGFIDGLRHAGVPRRDWPAIVGCDDIAEASWPAYDLTTLRQDPELLSEACIEALATRIAHPNSLAETRTISVAAVRRGTTRKTDID
ncbi:LacI family transcriptional regulator [Mesobaculum littorinae]|uniref:LacI family transcriptional regulator n=1 Tax=Mesobaculum littorinae TaxID=2486419 RepID=A0A438AKE6_9RHOB|nr:substrate-binding domain-containing protein [Mesobaculum littorinae]RVV99188.1 LacI family transcriptional regulator [Mesobaculum littorinae]